MNNTENLDVIVSKLKEKGIQAGEAEKQERIEAAKKEAEKIISEAKKQSENIIEEADKKAKQAENNALTAIKQASRDMIEATKIAMLDYLKSVFGNQCKEVFTREEYLQELLKIVLSSISDTNKISIPENTIPGMQAFLQKEALAKSVELSPLKNNEAKIIVKSTGKDEVEFVLSSKDVEEGLFSLLNKDLVERITNKKEG